MTEFLTGKRFNCISRAVDMLCLFIGDDYTYISCGKEIPVSEYALHFQTQWRFTDDKSIVLGSRDIYEPYNCAVPDDWEYDIIGRTDEESSIFDVNAKKMNLAMRDAVVVNAAVSPFGDLDIVFSNGIRFHSFTPASRKGEEWRLIDYKAKTHTIIWETPETA